ncbi:Inositolphosphorylceramide-B hydroxylase [Basidiobolus meristosporus CBS 931.73]|uniref:Ceramide very long chain fatty acid hydroxylase n=1 Tax=Basidiobolus meristosporus CBS 931.73 TaxID=1314790 RepID=A0A1Y1X5K9_9FUNG|nr:Inositolphosphorylceramide-B hydroxylase [Basidiobolus meristosporus CBS 931.73]|eukprot:ORX81101.1 Inositolphosphorylceramide-B hydroxylase [Basidiobolus meristosporus CBS 931.73]
MTAARLFTASEVAAHSSPKSVWVTFKNKVYDITTFLDSHPGGDEVILEYGGKDITNVLSDVDLHEHSDSAYDMLEDLCIGELATEEQKTAKIVTLTANGPTKRKGKAEDLNVDMHSNTDTHKDFQSQKFLDLNKPLVPQMWNNRFNKEFYLKQVHIPRHLPQPATFFTNPLLEMLTRTPWYVIPIIWFPISMYFFVYSLGIVSLQWSVICFVSGIFLWTALEYVIHRFLFHFDESLPDHPKAFFVHFLLHGVHHYLPMDGLRLVMPPALSFTLATPLVHLAYLLFKPGTVEAVISGTFFGYMCYDLVHYHLHHARPLLEYLRLMKTYHLDHHYKDFEENFGITTMIWDVVFQTMMKAY